MNRRVREAVIRALHGLTISVASSGAFAADLPVPVVGNSVSHGAATQVQQGTNLTINQLTDRATLNWQSFDIAANHSVRFNQPSANSVALNRIHQGSASKILGNLTANGQIYLVNRNGILFGSSAQVNVNSLIASSLDIADDVHERLGIVGAINEGAGLAALEGSGDMGKVEVAAGARITSARQGRVILAAPEVINHGVINTPDGQAILAASKDKVYIAPSNDSSLRGLVVEVGEGGAASNYGQIVAERGNVSIVGLAVNQSGLARASTSITLNGSVHLMARDTADIVRATGGNTLRSQRSGELTLGTGSVTEVIPELTGETAVDAQPQPTSIVKVVGNDIEMKSGARITARGGDVQVYATAAPNQTPRADVESESSLVIESGAVIDVSGLDSAVESVSRNIVTVEARGNELRDSPLQRDGALRGKKLQVDMRKGTDLLDISGVTAGVRRTLDERLSEGGTVQLLSEGHVDVADGTRVDLSGGKVTYTGGTYRTTRLITEDRKLVDISDADPNTRYTGIAGDFSVRHERWGVVETFSNFAGSGGLQYEEGYVEGKDAGSLQLLGRSMAFQGQVVANTVAGRYQRSAPTAVADGTTRAYDQRPLGGRVDLTFGTLDTDKDRSELLLQAEALAPERNEDGTLKHPGKLILGREFFDSGVSHFSLESKGDLVLDADLAFELPQFGSLSLEGGRVDIAGDVRVRNGSITAIANDDSRPLVDLEDVSLTVVGSAHLDVSGVWINDSQILNPVTPTSALAIEGGSVSLSSEGDLTLTKGSSIDADGGAWLRQDGSVVAGDGGSISLGLTNTNEANLTALTLGGDLSAYALSQGGSLTLSGNGFQIGVIEPEEDHDDHGEPRMSLAEKGIVSLGADFFTTGGFGSFTLNARQSGILVAEGTQALPAQQNYLLRNGHARVATGAFLDEVADRVRLPDWQRNAADIILTSRQRMLGADVDPNIRIEDGARIGVEAGGRINIVSDSSIHLAGDLTAPAGEVALSLLPFGTEYIPSQKIWLGSDADISAVGTARLTPDPLGFRFGEVLSGGSISLTANRGSIVLSEGSSLDVSGVSEVLDLPDYSSTAPGLAFTPVNIDGGAGSISLFASETILAEGELLGRASDAPGAPAGSISITLDPRNREDPPQAGVVPFQRGPRVIQVGETSAVSVSRSAAIPTFLNGFAFIDPDTLHDGGFTDVSFTARPLDLGASTQSTAEIRFTGEVDLNPAHRLVLDAPIIGGNDAQVSLSSAYVAIGSTDTQFRLDGRDLDGGGIIQADPTAGTGTLRVRGDLVELVGDTALQGFATASDDAGVAPVQIVSNGDLRLRGTRIGSELRLAGSFRAAGDIEFSAAQVHPTTLSEFTLAVEGEPAAEGEPESTLRITSPGGTAPGAPMSGGGVLTVKAPVIEQNGVLRAPFGSISMEANRVELGTGSLTSTSGAGLSMLFGQTQLLKDLVFPFTNGTRVLDEPTPKSVSLEAPEVDVQSGSVIDVSGGGELIATEFIPGPGGSRDILENGAIDGAFAILPTLGSSYAPYDPLETPGFDGAIGETIHIAGGGGIPAGEYAILPARYALLGGYLVTPVDGTTDADPSRVMRATDGFPIVAGKRGVAGSNAQESRWSGYKLEPASFVRQRSQFAETKIDSLFPEAGELTRDSGSLVIEASRSLNLAGSLAENKGTGVGPRVDIVADALAIVSQRSGDEDVVELLASDLSRFGAASLLVGGTRARGEDGTTVNVASESITVADGATVSGREVILAARDSIEIGDGAHLTASGSVEQSEESLLVSGDSAIASVSTRRPLTLERSNTNGTVGTLSVGAGAVVGAPGSIILDAARDSTIRGSLQSQDGSIALGAATITLGDAPPETDGLVLSNATLNALSGTDLQLRSNTTVNLVNDVSLDLRSFTADAAGLFGSGEESQATIRAGTITLANQTGATTAEVPEGTGALSMTANQLIFGEGNFRIDGYDAVSLRAEQALTGRDEGHVTITAPTEIRAPVMLAEGGAKTSLEVLGSLVVADTGTTAATNLAGLGGSWDIKADSVSLGTKVLLPSGQLSVEATGEAGITLTDAASVNVAGVDLDIAGHIVGTPGGLVSLTADAGDVRLEGRAAIDVSGASRGGEAGGIRLSAAQGAIQASSGATLRANSTVDGTGSFEADAIALGDFGALNATLNAGSFEALRSFRQREGDLVLAAGQQVRSGEVSLTADQGSITIAGQIDAARATGGRVEIAASDTVTLTSTGQISARATEAGQAGGTVLLSSSTAEGSIVTERRADGSASIDVSGRDELGATSATGYVHVSALRRDDNDINVDRFDGRIAGARRVDLEALKIYDVSDTGFVTNSLINDIRNHNTALAAGFDAVKTRLGLANDPAFHVVAGVEIRSTGTLNTGSQLDLSDWRAGGEAGFLHLRAGEDLTVAGSISDGFRLVDMFDLINGPTQRVRLQDDHSWSYSLTAGADFSSASRRALVRDAHNLQLLNDVVVRTGTGSIDLASSGDIRLGSPTSTIYTAGRNAGFGSFGDLMLDVFGTGEPVAFGTMLLDLWMEGAEFAAAGGNIDIRAQGDFIGTPGNQLFTDWMPRLGGEGTGTNAGELPAYWGVIYDRFQQGVGALGGGNLSVKVGGDLSGVSLSLPTTGKAIGDLHLDQDSLAQGIIDFTGGDVETEISGGGNLAVDVGGDIRGGAYYVGQGSATIRSGGSIGVREGATVAPILALGDATFDVQARGNLTLETVLNPTIIRSPRIPFGAPLGGFFFTYGDDSAVSLRSLAGDIELKNRLTEITDAYNVPASNDQQAMGIYPGTLVAHSYGGDTRIDRRLTTFPTPKGRLEILAAGDLVSAPETLIIQSDADPDLLPSVSSPTLDDESNLEILEALARLQPLGPTVHAAEPLHRGDTTSNLIAAGGSITPDDSTMGFYLAKQSRILAGDDIESIALRIQHNNDDDVSVLSAGGNIVQPTQRNQNGNFSAEAGPGARIIEISGGGAFDVLAGGTVDLGTSLGIRSVGDTTNAELADSGADITVMAGLGPAGADWNGFADKYLAPNGRFASGLAAYLEDFETDPSLTPLENFKRLPVEKQRPFALEVFFTVLRDAGTKAAETKQKEDYDPGYEAIKVLFPGEDRDRQGDLVSLLSQIATVDGGNINLLVPGGLVNAGVASASIVVKTPEQLGIVAQRDGDINAFVRDDFIVNQSRVFALDGGDITIWSSKGDIDAGRGAKTALAVPPPRVSFDADGNLVVEFPPAIAGSGIRGAVSTPGRRPGDVYLFAPVGVVDAGDAGIGSAGNVVIGATEVIGADNIDVGGVSVGIPVDTGGIAAGLTNVSSVSSSATSSATEQLGGDSTPEQPAVLADSALSWLEVFVIGLGEENCRPDDAACLQRSQRPD